MAKDRSRSTQLSRRENTREERKTIETKELLTFSFKDLDENQPANNPESLIDWHNDNLLVTLFSRLRDLSKLTRSEAERQQQIKIYGDFPSKEKTDFQHPAHVRNDVAWGVIKSIGGQIGTVAGYVVENTFYIVFLDKRHRFWVSEKKHT